MLHSRALTAETPQDPGSLVTLFIQRRRPERLTADFICELIYRGSQLVRPSPSLIEALLAALLRPVPGGKQRSNPLHDGLTMGLSSDQQQEEGCAV